MSATGTMLLGAATSRAPMGEGCIGSFLMATALSVLAGRAVAVALEYDTRAPFAPRSGTYSVNGV